MRHRQSTACLSLVLLGLLILVAPLGAAGNTDTRSESRDAVSGKLDLNRATLEEILDLPIDETLAQAIYDHRTYIGYFEHLYDLTEIEGMTPAALGHLRTLVATLPPERRDEALERYDASFRQVQRFLSQEGASEELADEYMDLLREPKNINDMSLYELQGFQNISPIDAVAILKARERSGSIDNARQMRGSEGLRYFSHRNLRDYVVYTDPIKDWKLRGDLQLLTFNTPYQGDATDLASEIDTGIGAANSFFLVSPQPAVLTKLRLRLGNEIKGGVMTFRDVGEDKLDETHKGFVTWSPKKSSLGIKNVVLGSYRVAFGQGLIMDNTDFFLPRKTGYGWNKRPLSIMGDLSRSHEFALNGAAVEFEYGRVHGTGFFSKAKKDGIMNADGTINRYIVMEPRYTDEILEQANLNYSGEIKRDAFEEQVLGGNLKFQLWPGTYVGVSGYEASYDNKIRPDVLSLLARPDLLEGRDSEIYADYDSYLGTNDDGEVVDVDFRRVVGTEFQAVYKNMAVQGEYAKLDSDPNGGISGLFSSTPDAFVVNGMVQYEDLSIMGLYRDYDVAFDNPYSRAFSNDTRYEQTLLGDPFRLNNPLLSWLATTTPQPKPERGFYLTTRYRVSRSFTISGLDFDQWERKADGQDIRRYTFRAEYAPIFPLRFRLRQRMSSRGESITADVRRFQSWDTRLEMRLRLSGYDELRFLYSATNTKFAPRPRLSAAVDEGSLDNPFAQAASPGHALQGQLIHNVNENLQITMSSLLYDGFLWNFEDNEFALLDNRGLRNWLLIRSRLGDSLLLRLKFTHDRHFTKTNVSGRDYDNYLVDPDTGDVYGIGDNLRSSETAFRLQLDYTF